jgi:hypothetical protein
LRRPTSRRTEFGRRGLNGKDRNAVLPAERLAGIGRFARSIVHNLKNLRSVLSLAAEFGCSASTPHPLRAKGAPSSVRPIGFLLAMGQ